MMRLAPVALLQAVPLLAQREGPIDHPNRSHYTGGQFQGLAQIDALPPGGVEVVEGGPQASLNSLGGDPGRTRPATGDVPTPRLPPSPPPSPTPGYTHVTGFPSHCPIRDPFLSRSPSSQRPSHAESASGPLPRDCTLTRT